MMIDIRRYAVVETEAWVVVVYLLVLAMEPNTARQPLEKNVPIKFNSSDNHKIAY